jgi:UTP--glucose-1-phosphate uridylyltransferase
VSGASPVRKAVIPAAGLGTRFLPATKAQPKEMLPVVDTPAIQYVVAEAASLGIRDVLIVTGRGKRSIEDHFDRSFELEHYLEAAGKLDELRLVREICTMADIHYVRQSDPKGLGHAVLAARQHVGDEPFIVMLGDDIMDGACRVSASMIELYAETGASVVALSEVPPQEISQYGCARVEREGDRIRIVELVEKPPPERAPSNLAVMGRYVLTPAIFDRIAGIPPGRGGEIQLTDAIAALMEDEPVYGFSFQDGRYDIGNKLDYLKATITLALARADLGPGLREFLRGLDNQFPAPTAD